MIFTTFTERPDITHRTVVSRNVQRIALTEITSEVVGCIFDLHGGTIGILPPPDNITLASQFLAKIVADLYREHLKI